MALTSLPQEGYTCSKKNTFSESFLSCTHQDDPQEYKSKEVNMYFEQRVLIGWQVDSDHAGKWALR